MSDELSERERLIRYVDAAQGHFSLTMARYTHEGLARELWEGVLGELQALGRTIAVVDFAGVDDDVDILERISSLAVGVDGAFVVGLDNLLVAPNDRPRSTGAIATFNFNRDLLRDRLAIPVVLWLSQRAARAFARLAADTFDILRTTFEFPEKPDVAADPASVDDRVPLPIWLRPAPASERPRLEQRQRILESLHADATPGSLMAGDLAASAASVACSLGLEEPALEWLAKAARDHELAGSHGAAATDHRRRAELLAFHGKLNAASEEIRLATEAAVRAIGSDDVLVLSQTRLDIIAARASIVRVRETSVGADLQRLERWRGGDSEAGQYLLSRIFNQAYLYFLMRRRVDIIRTEDLVREVFLRIHAGVPDYRGQSTFHNYVDQVAYAVYADHQRRHDHRRPID